MTTELWCWCLEGGGCDKEQKRAKKEQKGRGIRTYSFDKHWRLATFSTNTKKCNWTNRFSRSGCGEHAVWGDSGNALRLGGGGDGVKLENLWNKKAQINTVDWQDTRVDNNKTNKAQVSRYCGASHHTKLWPGFEMGNTVMSLIKRNKASYAKNSDYNPANDPHPHVVEFGLGQLLANMVTDLHHQRHEGHLVFLVSLGSKWVALM